MKKLELNFGMFGVAALALALIGCVSDWPREASIQDGVRCPIASENPPLPSSEAGRFPASEKIAPTRHACAQLFAAP
jgi:hypothetical protein